MGRTDKGVIRGLVERKGLDSRAQKLIKELESYISGRKQNISVPKVPVIKIPFRWQNIYGAVIIHPPSRDAHVLEKLIVEKRIKQRKITAFLW